MSYTVCNVLDLGEAYTGATLNAQLYDSSNNTVGSAITTGFYERAGSKGIYTFALSVPDGHQGWCDVYVSGAASTVLATLPLNPAELENADVKTSLVKAKTDNLPSDPADASDIATSFSVVNASLATIAGYIDTEVAAIKAKTDALPAVPAAVSDIPTANDINTALSTVHGAGSWATATGFATPTNVTTAQTSITAAIAALNNLSTGDIDARLAAYDGATQADLDTAKAAVLAAIAALNNLSQSQAQAAGAAALLAYSTATAGNVASAQTAIAAAIAALNNLSQAQAQAAAIAALNAYDGPTKAELDAAQVAIQADIAGIEGGGGGSSAADIWTCPDRTLTRFGSMTGIEFTYTVTNSVNGLPLSGVAVWFAVDGGGAQIVWSGHTDALGVARDAYGALPRLDPGTYYVFRSRPGYVFRNPDTEIVNE